MYVSNVHIRYQPDRFIKWRVALPVIFSTWNTCWYKWGYYYHKDSTWNDAIPKESNLPITLFHVLLTLYRVTIIKDGAMSSLLLWRTPVTYLGNVKLLPKHPDKSLVNIFEHHISTHNHTHPLQPCLLFFSSFRSSSPLPSTSTLSCASHISSLEWIALRNQSWCNLMSRKKSA